MRSLIFEIFPGPQAALVAAACRVMLERGLGPAEVLAQYEGYSGITAKHHHLLINIYSFEVIEMKAERSAGFAEVSYSLKKRFLSS